METDASRQRREAALSVPALRAFWFERIERLHQAATERSGLECASRCTARCCPQSKAVRDPSDAVGHVAIMLPFEAEYIVSKTGATSAALQYAPVEIAPGITIDIGFTTSAVPCPFLTDGFQCGIHAFRPLDCRSFPLIPVFMSDGAVTFRLETECPSVHTFSAACQTQLKAIWRGLLDDLPMDYRALYNEL